MACPCGTGIDPKRLYLWPDDVRRLTRLGHPSLNRLLRGGLEVRQLGRRTFVRGRDLARVIWEQGKTKEG